MRRLMLGFVVLPLVFASATQAQKVSTMAAAADDCGSFAPCCCNAHVVLNQMYDDGKGLHSDCLICQGVFSGEPKPTYRCHPQCDFTGSETLSYNALLDAARTGDYRRASSLVPLAPHYAIINYERRSIQILSCDRSQLIGNIPISATYVGVAWIAPFTPVSASYAATAFRTLAG